MAPFARTTRSQQCTHGLSNTSLAANHFPVVIGRDMQFQYQGVAIIANFANLY
jgi:hypothetical protein